MPGIAWLVRNLVWLNKVLIALFALYAVSMVAFPFIRFSDWNVVQQVWDRWQGLNVGVLAFSTSVIAFNIAIYKDSMSTARQYRAARAFLPQALSEIGHYTEDAFDYLRGRSAQIESAGGFSGVPDATPPTLPVGHQEIFRQCLLSAEPKVAEALADLLGKLQVFRSRMSATARLQRGGRINIVRIENLVFDLCVVRAANDALFKHARGHGDEIELLSAQTVRTAGSLLGIYEDAELDKIFQQAKSRYDDKTDARLPAVI